MVVVEGVARKINPNTNIWEVSRPILENWLKEIKDPINKISETVTQSSEVFKKLPKRTDIRFIGAEPTMNDGLFEMIKVAKRYKHRPQILTNGLKLGQEQYVIDLKKSGLNWLGLSMNGGLDDEVY